MAVVPSPYFNWCTRTTVLWRKTKGQVSFLNRSIWQWKRVRGHSSLQSCCGSALESSWIFLLFSAWSTKAKQKLCTCMLEHLLIRAFSGNGQTSDNVAFDHLLIIGLLNNTALIQIESFQYTDWHDALTRLIQYVTMISSFRSRDGCPPNVPPFPHWRMKCGHKEQPIRSFSG